MSIALLSALSLICIDVASAARPLPMTPPAPIIVAAVQGTATAPKGEAAQPVVVTQASADDDAAFDAPLVFEDESDEIVATKLIEYLEGIDTLNGDFTQIAPSGAISVGKFFLRRPGFLRFEYEPPTPLLLVANGGMVYVRDEALETTDSYPVGKTPLKFLLSKKINRDDAKVIQVDRGIDTVAVTFASSDEETEGELTLIATAPDFALRRWIVRDLQGGATIVTLENVKSGERLANSLFAAPDAGGRFLNK